MAVSFLWRQVPRVYCICKYIISTIIIIILNRQIQQNSGLYIAFVGTSSWNIERNRKFYEGKSVRNSDNNLARLCGDTEWIEQSLESSRANEILVSIVQNAKTWPRLATGTRYDRQKSEATRLLFSRIQRKNWRHCLPMELHGWKSV